MKYDQYIEDSLIKGLTQPAMERFNVELTKAVNTTINDMLNNENIKNQIIKDLVYAISRDITHVQTNYENRSPLLNGLQEAIVEKIAERITDQDLKGIIIAGLIRK